MRRERQGDSPSSAPRSKALAHAILTGFGWNGLEPLEERVLLTTYGPLITFPTWNQDGNIGYSAIHYNDYVPLDPATGTRSVVGCVATAEAQVLYYWHFPQGMSFSESSDSYMSQGVNIDADATTYGFPSFAALNTSLSSIAYDGDPVEEALLSFAVGIKAQMQYSSSSSAASLDAATFTKLGFASADESYYNWNVVKPTVIANIESNHPVLVSLAGSGGDHAVILDGYNSDNDTFHVNLGWGPGTDNTNGNNDWYSLPVINAGGYSFTGIDEIIYNPGFPGWVLAEDHPQRCS